MSFQTRKAPILPRPLSLPPLRANVLILTYRLLGVGHGPVGRPPGARRARGRARAAASARGRGRGVGARVCGCELWGEVLVKSGRRRA